MRLFPSAGQVEVPILQELQATGGSDAPRYLQERLLSYFPQLLSAADLAPAAPLRRRFGRLMQRAGVKLAERGELQRERARWQLTEAGRRRAEAESLSPLSAAPEAPRALSHGEAQELLCDLGRLLGHDALPEHQFYDVVWRDSPQASRASHVFEVQVAGSVDSALTRLKQAHEEQRSLLFLVVANERSARFAAQRLQRAYPELVARVTVLGAGELERLHRSLSRQGPLLRKLAARG